VLIGLDTPAFAILLRSPRHFFIVMIVFYQLVEVEFLTFWNLLQALSPENTYGVDSGGDPNEIPKLTFEEFKV